MVLTDPEEERCFGKVTRASYNSDEQRQSMLALEGRKSLPTISRSIERMTIDIRNTRKCPFGVLSHEMTPSDLRHQIRSDNLIVDRAEPSSGRLAFNLHIHGFLQILQQQHRPAGPFCWATNITSRQCNRDADLGLQCFSHEEVVAARENVE